MTTETIQQTRARLGLTQRQLAAYLSSLGYPVSRRTIEGWEAGRPPAPVYGAALRQVQGRADMLERKRQRRQAVQQEG